MIVVYNLHFGPCPFVGLLRCELMLVSIADLNYIYLPEMSQKWQEKSPVNSFLVTFRIPTPNPNHHYPLLGIFVMQDHDTPQLLSV